MGTFAGAQFLHEPCSKNTMKIIRNYNTFLCVTFLIFIAGCTGSGNKDFDFMSGQGINSTSILSQGMSSDSFIKKKCCVWKKQGIIFTLKDKITKTTIDEGEQVFLIENKTTSDNQAVWLMRENDSGYTNEGKYLLPIPAFMYESYGCGYSIEAYVEKHKAEGYVMNFKKIKDVDEQGHSKFTFEFLVTNIYESFIILKRIFYIPDTYEFPSEKFMTLATPGMPNPANKNREAVYITQTFELQPDSAGKPTGLTWFDDDEVGFIRVKMSVLSNRTIFNFEGGGH